MKKLIKFVLFGACIAATGTSQALMIDFTDKDKWGGADGKYSYTVSYDSLDVKATSSPSRITFNGSSSEKNGCSGGSNPLKCDGDGLGIKNDEIKYGELLTIEFSTAIDVLDILVLDLFGKQKEQTGEVARVKGSNGVTKTYGHGETNSTSGGFASLSMSFSNVTSLGFFSINDGFSDYALAALKLDMGSQPPVTATPVPGAIWLFGSGLIGLIGFSRRKKQ